MRAFRLDAFGMPLVPSGSSTPAPAGGQVLLRTEACGVCHSDLHMADGFFDLGNGGALMQHDGCLHAFAPFFVGQTDDGDILDEGMRADHRLDL